MADEAETELALVLRKTRLEDYNQMLETVRALEEEVRHLNGIVRDREKAISVLKQERDIAAVEVEKAREATGHWSNTAIIKSSHAEMAKQLNDSFSRLDKKWIILTVNLALTLILFRGLIRSGYKRANQRRVTMLETLTMMSWSRLVVRVRDLGLGNLGT